MTLSDGINHVALVTADLDRFIAFYRDVFDAEVVVDMHEEHVRHALVDMGGGACLHPFALPDNPHARGSADIFGRGHLDHVAIDVADMDRFEELRRRLVERGASDGAATDFGVVRTVAFRDPDGLEAEIALWRHGRALRRNEVVREPYPAPTGTETVEPARSSRARPTDGRERADGAARVESVSVP